MEDYPEIASKVKSLVPTVTLGRPVYADNEDLVNVIKDIAIIGSAADERRSIEQVRSDNKSSYRAP